MMSSGRSLSTKPIDLWWVIVIASVTAVCCCCLRTSSLQTPSKNMIVSDEMRMGMLLVADLNGTLTAYTVHSLHPLAPTPPLTGGSKLCSSVSLSEAWSTQLSEVMFSAKNVSSKPILFNYGTNTPIYLTPSLQGGLFLVHNESVESLPFTTDSLFTRSFQLPGNSILVGTKEVEATRIDLNTGKVVFRSSATGGGQFHERHKRATLETAIESNVSALFRVTSRLVKAIDSKTGEEKWQFQVRDVTADDALTMEQFAQFAKQNAGDPNLEFLDQLSKMFLFSVPYGEIYVIDRIGQSGRVCKVTPSVRSPIVRAWLLTGSSSTRCVDVQRGVDELDVFNERCSNLVELDLFDLSLIYDPLVHAGSASAVCAVGSNGVRTTTLVKRGDVFDRRTADKPAFYFGKLNDNYYVQVSDERLKQMMISSGRSEQSALSVRGPRNLLSSAALAGEDSVAANGVCGTAEVERWAPANSLDIKPVSAITCTLPNTLLQGAGYYYVHGSANSSTDANKSSDSIVCAILRSLEQGAIKSSMYTFAALIAVYIWGNHRPEADALSSHRDSSPSLPAAEIKMIQPSFCSVYTSEYEHLGCLGVGGFGVVFRAKNKIDHREVAVKRVQIDSDSMIELDEVRTLAAMHHDNVIRYYCSWVEKPTREWQDETDRELMGSENYEQYKEMNESQSDDDNSSYSNNESDQLQSSGSFTKKSNYVIFDHTGSVNSNNNNNSTANNHHLSTWNELLGPKTSSGTHITFLYLVMELCGQTLSQWLVEHDTHEQRPYHLMFDFFSQITAGIAYVHSMGAAHRDIKPSNILFSLEGRLKISDFGLVCTTSDLNERASKQAVGTDLYMSPEQRKGHTKPSQIEKVDIYALGVILFELFYPFTTASERIRVLSMLVDAVEIVSSTPSNKVAQITQIAQEFPTVWALVNRLMCNDPEKRPSAKEILTEILDHHTKSSKKKTI